MYISLQREKSGSGPLGQGSASQHVCSAALSGSLAACYMLITYGLGLEEDIGWMDGY